MAWRLRGEIIMWSAQKSFRHKNNSLSYRARDMAGQVLRDARQILPGLHPAFRETDRV